MSRTRFSGAAHRRRANADRAQHATHHTYQQKSPVAEQPPLMDIVLAEAPEPTPMPAELASPNVSPHVMVDKEAVVPAIHPAPELQQHKQQQQQHQQHQEQLQPRPRPFDGPGHGKGPQHARHRSLPQRVPRSRQHQRNHHHERRVSYPPAASPQQQQEQNYYIPRGYAIDPQAHYQQFLQVTPHDNFTYHHEQTWQSNPYQQQHQQQQVQLHQQFGYGSPNSSDEGSLVGGYGFQGGAEGNIDIMNGQGNYYPPSSSYPYHDEQQEQAPIPYYNGPPPPSPLATEYGMLAAGYPSSPYPGHTPSSSYDSHSSYSSLFCGNPQPPHAHAEELSFPHYYQQQQQQLQGGMEGGMEGSNYNPPHPDMMTTATVQQGNSSSSSSSTGSGTEEEMKMLEQGERGMEVVKREGGVEEEGREEVLASGITKYTRGGLTYYTYPDDAARLAAQAEATMEMSASGHSHHSYLSFEQQQQQQQQYQCYTPPGSPPMQPYQHVSPPHSPVTTSPVLQYEQQFFGNAPHPQYPYHEEQQHYNGSPSPRPPPSPLPLPSSSVSLNTMHPNYYVPPHHYQPHHQLQQQVQQQQQQEQQEQQQQQQEQQQSPVVVKAKSPPPSLPTITEDDSVCASLPPQFTSLDKSAGSNSSSGSETSKALKKTKSSRTKGKGQSRTTSTTNNSKPPTAQQLLIKQHQQQNQPKWHGRPRMPLFTTKDYAGKAYTFYQPDDYHHVICYPTRFFHCPQPPLPFPAKEMERRGLPYGPTYGPLAPWHFPCERQPRPVGPERK